MEKRHARRDTRLGDRAELTTGGERQSRADTTIATRGLAQLGDHRGLVPATEARRDPRCFERCRYRAEVAFRGPANVTAKPRRRPRTCLEFFEHTFAGPALRRQ